MKIKPIGERVLLKAEEEPEKTESGIYIPEQAREKKKEGIVEAVGTFKDGKPLPLKPGEKVLYTGYSNEEVEIDGKEYVIVDFKDVIAKLE